MFSNIIKTILPNHQSPSPIKVNYSTLLIAHGSTFYTCHDHDKEYGNFLLEVIVPISLYRGRSMSIRGRSMSIRGVVIYLQIMYLIINRLLLFIIGHVYSPDYSCLDILNFIYHIAFPFELYLSHFLSFVLFLDIFNFIYHVSFLL